MKSFENYKKEFLQDPEFNNIHRTLSVTPSTGKCYLSPKVCDRILKNAAYVNGKIVISKDDEWAKETEWDDLYEELVKKSR